MRVELTVSTEFASASPRSFLLSLVRTICLPALRSLSLTFAVCPGGMLATPEANRSRLRTLAALSSPSRKARAGTKTLTATLQGVPSPIPHCT